jgi:hypothetical protein
MINRAKYMRKNRLEYLKKNAEFYTLFTYVEKILGKIIQKKVVCQKFEDQ